MLNALNPLSKIVVCFVWLVAAILIFDARFQMASIAAAAFALVVFGRVSPLTVLALMVPFALFGFGFLTTSVLFRQESDFALNVARVSVLESKAVSAGLILFLRAIACGMISSVFALTTDAGAFVRSLMRNCGLPARIGYSLFAALQLVPDLASEAQHMRLARAMRSGRPLRRIPGPVELAGLVIPLLAFAIRRAGRTAIALEARGLSGGPRSILNAPPLRYRDGAFVLAGIGAIGAAWIALRLAA